MHGGDGRDPLNKSYGPGEINSSFTFALFQSYLLKKEIQSVHLLLAFGPPQCRGPKVPRILGTFFTGPTISPVQHSLTPTSADRSSLTLVSEGKFSNYL